MTPLLAVHIGATLAMTGLIWFVQVVHYPLMAAVGPSAFSGYHAFHLRRTGRIVVPLMLLELVTAVGLVAVPGAAPAGPAWLALGLLGTVWLSTAAVQAPQHRALTRGFDRGVLQRLVASNWLRTAGWSARALIVLWIAVAAAA